MVIPLYSLVGFRGLLRNLLSTCHFCHLSMEGSKALIWKVKKIDKTKRALVILAVEWHELLRWSIDAAFSMIVKVWEAIYDDLIIRLALGVLTGAIHTCAQTLSAKAHSRL